MSGEQEPVAPLRVRLQKRARLEEIIGQRILARRAELQLTQEQLAERVGERLRRDWTRQAVSAAEKGKRSFTAVELVAIANVLGVNIGRLLTPPPDLDLVVLGQSGTKIGGMTPEMLKRALVSVIAVDGQPLDKVQDLLNELSARVVEMQGAAGEVARSIDAINEYTSAALLPPLPPEYPETTLGTSDEETGEFR